MSFDVTTLALAKSYADQHSGGGGSVGDITAEDVSYPNSFGEGSPENVGQALDVLITGFSAPREDVLRLNKSEHTHSNKAVLDKFAETNGKPTYDGEALGGGGSVDSVNGKTGAVVLTAEDINYDNDNTVYELMSQWSVDLESVGNALTTLDKNSHTHDNKDTLDKLSDSNGKLQYNGSDVGLKGDKGADGANGKDGTNGITPTIGANGNWYLATTDTGKPSRGEKGDKGADGTNGKDGINGKTPVKGTDYWTEADKAEIVDDVLAALPTWTGGSY